MRCAASEWEDGQRRARDGLFLVSRKGEPVALDAPEEEGSRRLHTV